MVTKDGSSMSGRLIPEVTTDPTDGSSATSRERSQVEVDVAVEEDKRTIILNGPKRELRSSKYHGVSKHRTTGKYEAFLWHNHGRLEGRPGKGRQVYLGCYDSEEKAARAHDLATLKYRSPISRKKLNFPVSEYENELQAMIDFSREEFVAYIRRSSCSFSRGASAYRGVTRGQRHGQWQARIYPAGETKDMYIGTFETEEEAAEAYDIAAIELRGPNAVTNFDIRNYCRSGLGLLDGAS